MLRRIFLLFASVKFAALSNVTYVGTTDLLEHLFKSYDRRVRPYADNKTAVYVHMTIVLGIMIEMHENEQVVSFVISHTQRWRDPKLVWDPSDFNGMTEAIVPQSMLWLPKMFVYNSMDTKDMLTEEKYDVRLRHDGQVKINIPQHVTCICRLNIEQFPFDTQFCAVALASPLLTIEEMNCAIAVGVSMTFVILNRRLVDSGEYPRIFAYRLMFLRPKIFPRNRRKEEDRKASGMDTAPLIANGYTSSSCSTANNSKSSKSASISIPNGDSVNVTLTTKNTSGFGSDDLARIHTVVCYLAETQRIIRRKLEKDQLRMAIEKEWNRIFTRVDYASLVFFQALNAASLIFFLQFAWALSPEMREPLV
ncbi:Protein LGC-9 [Aphelenchoides avenae]|nr:Protein LGC-9 [Aphelenchus avenae]